MGYEWVSFTTDYGLRDGFVAACKGVLGRLAPRVRVLDVTHEVPPQDVRRGSVVLAQTVPYLPSAVHLAVVDPGVGTRRRGVAVVAGQGVLVGPDNGLLVPAAEALGGVRSVFELAEPRFWLPGMSRTFHGRDVFAPVSAWLASGGDPGELGPLLPTGELVRLPEPRCDVGGGVVRAEVLSVDGFGNLQLAVESGRVPSEWGRGGPLDVIAGQVREHASFGATFADVAAGGLVVLVDSAGMLAVALNGGSAADRLGVGAGGLVVLGPPELVG